MKVELKLKIPSLPNYVLIDDRLLSQSHEGFKESPSIPVQNLTDEQLIKLADEWKEELLKMARTKRQSRI